jgi:glycerophosphoryl diester phosphodiesterase
MRRLASWLLAVSLLPPLAELAGGAGPAPRVAAHRGGALLWPENSLLAFANALALGADLLELDVHLTADGEVVVIHDPTLERTTTGRGPVREQRLADLAPLRLRARDGTVTAEPVPTLGQVLDLLAPSRAELLLEVKVDDRKHRYPGIEGKVLAALRERGLAARTFVMAFEAPTVARVRELDADIRTVLLVARGQVEPSRTSAEEVARWVRDVKATALGIDYRRLDAPVVAAARRAGLTVATWTVNAEADIRQVIGLGVDIVISDRPDLALRLSGR